MHCVVQRVFRERSDGQKHVENKSAHFTRAP